MAGGAALGDMDALLDHEKPLDERLAPFQAEEDPAAAQQRRRESQDRQKAETWRLVRMGIIAAPRLPPRLRLEQR